ncbi:hypothetical protein KJ966_05245 [bacterium]|nr:hypothetical protein [bacterium]
MQQKEQYILRIEASGFSVSVGLTEARVAKGSINIKNNHLGPIAENGLLKIQD